MCLELIPNKGNEVLVRWKGLLEFATSLEPHDLIGKQFPKFHFVGKVKMI